MQQYSDDADDADDEQRYVREVKTPIPLNTLTQEKVHRKRPAPSPASGRYNANGTQYSWKRPSHEPSQATKKLFVHDDRRNTLTGDDCMSTPTGGKSSTLAKLASNLLQQLENEPVGTLLVYQPTCLDHHNDSHQESRQRLCVLGGPEGVLHKERFNDLTWANLNELRPAQLDDILRVHTFEYIQHLERACRNLPEQNSEYLVGTLYDKQTDEIKSKELTFTEWLKTENALKCFEVEDQPSGGSFDMDSPISKSSYMAARMAAGAVCHAVDKVLNNETKNAFVVVRPPGHHAGPNGCVEGEGFHLRPDMCTCGFCLLNNVCIGASYAMSNYCAPYYTPSAPGSSNSGSLLEPRKRVGIKRVAIVDFDIHHGNGTEEVIRNLIPHKQNYPLPPSWAPVQFSSYKPWRDETDPDNVFFSSIHLYDDDNFYPCSGAGPHGCSPELEKSKNIVNLPLKALGPKYLDERVKLSAKAKRQLMEQASKAFRDNVTKKLIPALTKFRPDLIMISAGFDGHADDFYYFLTEDDYSWITEQVTAVAEDCCDGRVVSVLEGGYNVVPSKFQRPRAKGRKNATSNFHYAAKMHNRPVDEELNTYGSLARQRTDTMSERKAVIKNADMHEDMQQDAVDCASQALEKYNIEKDIAAFIKKEFDKKYNPTWHCIVGRNFGSYVTHETKHFIYFYLGQVAILLFKSG
ncbi:hypothetical protein BBO99_00006940 [Phytophthora kernoviae]|uniref:Histone deacetylase domain-containing protein n=3 Tax=Phytophthora kernoviae TaxID=325452 RepID=A0A421GJS5_9STRA|nr:hypothetical protein JM16_007893 [Phytophthora kernoviae]RLN77203.1 hypothetical protein BBO99_00006940 [Phytophthora kernoviae]